ncbi:EAL domain-containing protein [Saccharothrix sp. BKS2]|uniref:putative bifunctional diguanylate cyclase/phosphodiesterase n=1 Tax=Saccharothrix sp. BKS2 TaxID=3064400 RepID=UPI0039EB2139
MVEEAGAARPGDESGDDRGEFARRWAATIGSTVVADLQRPRLEALLAGFTTDLHTALRHDGPATAAQRAGRAMVEHGLRSASTLERSLAFVGDHLLDHFGLPADRAKRLMGVLAAFAAGFADGLRVHTLDEQEQSQTRALRLTRSAEAKLRASEAKFRAVFRTSPAAIAVTGLGGELLDCNTAMLDMLGRDAEELAGTTSRALVHPDDQAALTRLAERLRTDDRDQVHAELRLLGGDGEPVTALVSIALVRDDEDEPAYYVAVLEDLDEVRALQARLLHQSLHDVQTGLANRGQFVGWLENAVGTRGPAALALVVFDLDGFRVVNDAFGHEIGNRVLSAAAAHLRSVFGEVGQLARIGPDEFGVLIRDPVDVPAVVTYAEEVLDLLAEPVWVGEDGIGVTASVGIVVRAARGADATELMRCVDVTVRWAKEDGKAQWALYDPERDRRERTPMRLAASVAGGLEQGDFRVDYEPVRSSADRSLLAVEARLRWEHPAEGPVDPLELGPLVAGTGMAARLGAWALEQACHDAGRWHAELGAAAPVLTMNLTARQCQEPELVAEVRRVLRESGLPASGLRLELDEVLLGRLGEEQLEELAILTEHGVGLALDRVGNANHGIDRLRRLPLCGLKFEGAPMRGITADATPMDEDATAALLSWARTLGLPLHAAGVRTEDEVARLAGLGVSGVQGPLFGEPLSADGVAAILGKS